MSHNIDLLCGACLANGVSIEGHSYDEMRATLGSVLVDKMLGCPPTSPVKRDDQGGAKKRRAPSLCLAPVLQGGEGKCAAGHAAPQGPRSAS